MEFLIYKESDIIVVEEQIIGPCGYCNGPSSIPRDCICGLENLISYHGSIEEAIEWAKEEMYGHVEAKLFIEGFRVI